MASRLAEFEAVFSHLVDDLKTQCRQDFELPSQVWQWLENALLYNTIGGKCNRGLSVIDSERLLLGRELMPDEFVNAATLGWMIELLQAMMLVIDDIMDAGKTRRGKQCWYLVPSVGMAAVNDATMLESAIYMLLKKRFKNHPAYVDMMELFHEVAFKVELGQAYDMLTAPDGVVNLNNFNLDKYTRIVIFKTAYYSFYLPVALALLDTGKATQQNMNQAEKILIPMGEYFQVQDDYLDAFADPSVLGKVGTDIQDNKCSWLVNQALLRCSPAQRRALESNYGRKSDDAADDDSDSGSSGSGSSGSGSSSELAVKKVYQELQLDRVFHEYEDTQVRELKRMIAQVDESEGLKRSVFEEMLRKIYKRGK